MIYKIAIASSDGKVVNQHFGRAGVFYIVNADSGDMTFIYEESRKTAPVCSGQEHDDAQLKALAAMLRDCDYVLVSRIGYGARAALERDHTEAFELPGYIEDSIRRLLSYVEVRNLLNET
ncbi:NifB/NifX family molybdenum-iron cluster-binding protein [Clostridium sp. Marseille-P2415]|uniref:NifB/NifX family molybdenum-iron cluster-binding protein n=1 Tax=Clostridium sp. Marseille-P2415 TaxID=1805471 RepID=UPI000988430A|nr:NifB/NifX family molybdenum-iron cluster-binding protein [Clostridium sp. Marseille-P2415]